MKKNKVTKTVIVLNAVCAAMWALCVVMDIIAKSYNGSAIDIVNFSLHIACTVAFTAAFIVNLICYRSNKDK